MWLRLFKVAEEAALNYDEVTMKMRETHTFLNIPLHVVEEAFLHELKTNYVSLPNFNSLIP